MTKLEFRCGGMLVILVLALGLIVPLAQVSKAAPMGTAWTYQGRLIDSDSPADGLYDLQFKLFNGNQVVADVNKPDVYVIDGYFTVALDFNDVGVFNGDALWLQIGVRPGELGDPNEYTVLLPRQEITPVPYALQTRGIFVDNAGNVGIGTTTPRASLEVTNPGGMHAIWSSTNYIPVYALRTSTTGTWPAVVGDCNSQASGASGVRGRILSTSPGSLSAGVYGYNYGTGSNGVGVRGEHDGSGAGVYGQCNDGKGVYGVTTNGYAGYFAGGKNYFGGSVGIGTTNPRTDLEIQGATGLRVTTGQHSNVFGEFKHAYSGGLLINANAGGGWADISLQTDGTTRLFIESGGNVGIGTTGNPTERLTVRGNILVQSASTGASVAEIGEGLDYAEGFDVTEDADIRSGMVLVIDSDNPGKLKVSRSDYDSKVAGIVAGAKGLGSGVRLGVGQFDHDVALAGRVYCNVDASSAGIKPGDLLTTSSRPGYAMKALDRVRAQGAILGKAMESLEKGKTGQILVLVTLQ